MVSARLIAINIPTANEYITVQIATQYRQTNACTNKVIETETLDNLTAAVACVHLYSLNKGEGQGVGGEAPPTCKSFKTVDNDGGGENAAGYDEKT